MSRVIRDIKNSRGKRQVTIELEDGEKLRAVKAGCHTLVIADGEFYKLGYPVDDVIAAEILKEMVPVNWCSLEQRWVE